MQTLRLVFICKFFQSSFVAHLSRKLLNLNRMVFPRSCSCQGYCGVCYACAVGCLAETLFSKIFRWKRQ